MGSNPDDRSSWLFSPYTFVVAFIIAFMLTVAAGTLTAHSIFARTGVENSRAAAVGKDGASGSRPGASAEPPARPKYPDWPMHGSGPSHTSALPRKAGVPEYSELWHTELKGTVLTSAAGMAGVLYVGSADRGLYAIDASTGAVKWRFPTYATVVSSPAVAGGKVIFADTEGTLYVLETKSGQLVWSRTSDYSSSPVTLAPGPHGAPTRIYTGTARGVEAIDLAGHLQWSFAANGPVVSSPSVADGKVYFGSRDKSLYALYAATGALAWSTLTGGQIEASAAVHSGVVYVGSLDTKIYAIDAKTGMRKWVHSLGSEVKEPVAVGAYGTGEVARVFAVAGKKVFALSVDSGRESWRLSVPSTSAPALTLDAVLLAAGASILALDPDTGHVEWRSDLTGRLSTSPVLSEGRLIVGTSNRRLYAFGLASTSAEFPGPKLFAPSAGSSENRSCPAAPHSPSVPVP